MKPSIARPGLLFASLLFLAIPSPTPQDQKSHGHGWTYSGAEGPEHWGTLKSEYASCTHGRQQSPIDIRNAHDADLPAIHFDYKPTALKVIDNGHTIQVSYDRNSSITIGDRRYELIQFHFHHPSEEEIEGRTYDMVVHLVHRDQDGKLAVVAVLLRKGRVNAMLQKLWEHLPEVKEKETLIHGVEINAADLLPADRGYYSFPGSLTTPPCTEGVSWFVLKTPTEVSSAEIMQFGALYPHNARPVQPLNGRTILQTK
jgi:carbonic anhydrase